MSEFYEMLCCANLFSVFKLCCLGVSSALSISPDFSVTLPDLTSAKSDFISAGGSVQSSLIGISNVFWIFLTPRTVTLIFALLDKGRSLLEDPNFFCRDISLSCASRRFRLQNQIDSRYIGTLPMRKDYGLQWNLLTSSLLV